MDTHYKMDKSQKRMLIGRIQANKTEHYTFPFIENANKSMIIESR
jgi:hypothetical protein